MPTQAKIKHNGRIEYFTIENNETILEAALQNDIDIPFGCMSGSCNACQGHLDKGEVKMDVSDALTNEELKNGEILCCQARPVSEEIEISFND